MFDNSDNWLTICNYNGASFYFRRIKKHDCPVCGARLKESYTNKISWDTSPRAKRMRKEYLSGHYARVNVDERFYCFYCEKCKEYHSFAEIKKIEEAQKTLKKSANEANRHK